MQAIKIWTIFYSVMVTIVFGIILAYSLVGGI